MRMHAQLGFLTLAFVVWLANPQNARAQSTEGVVAVGGTAEPRDLTTISSAVNTALRAASWQLPAKPLSKKETDGLLQCLKPGEASKCVPESMSARGIGRALVVNAEKQQAMDGTPVVVLTGKVILVQSAEFVVRLRRCEPCTEDTLTQTSTGLTQQLLQELAVRAGRTLLSVSSNPQGANIVLDGQSIGATPMVAKTYPGRHIVQLDKAGYITVSRPTDTTEDSTSEIAVDLRRSDRSPEPDPKGPVIDPDPRGWWHVPAVFVGGGVLATGAAIGLLYLGQQDGVNDKDRYTHATVLGVITAVTGVSAVAFGGYRLWRGPPNRTVTVQTTAGGAVIGWAGSF